MNIDMKLRVYGVIDLYYLKKWNLNNGGAIVQVSATYPGKVHEVQQPVRLTNQVKSSLCVKQAFSVHMAH